MGNVFSDCNGQVVVCTYEELTTAFQVSRYKFDHASNAFGGPNVDVPPNIQSDTGDAYVFRESGRL